MSGHCLIVSGGAYCEIPKEARAADYVIACDRGYRHAERMGIMPDLIVGDFDSAPLPETAVPVERVPSRKDDTDTMLAARRAAELGYGEATICCCFGGRLDHTLANLQTAAWLVEHGASVRLTGTDTEAYAFTAGKTRIPRRDGWSLSLFSLSDRCEGVSIRGTEYDGENITIRNSFPVGISNRWSAGEAEISVRQGILLIIESRLKKGEHI